MTDRAPFAAAITLVFLGGCLSPANSLPLFETPPMIGGSGDVSKGVGVLLISCAPDYTTPFPDSPKCGAMEPPENNPKPPKKAKRQKTKGRFKCLEGGKYIYTSTYRMGCFAASLDEPGSRPSDLLKGLQ